MIATLPHARRRFAYYNDLIWRGRLPLPRLELSHARSYIGQLSWRKETRPWAVREGDYRIRLSTAFDIPEAELDDVLIHEMIHYDIALSRIRDTSPHGRVFTAAMDDINRRFGRHVSVSRRDLKPLVPPAPRSQRTPRQHAVAILSLSDGRRGLKVLPLNPRRIADYRKAAQRSPDVERVEIVTCKSQWLEQFPVSSAFRMHIVSREQIEQQLREAEPWQ